MYQLQDLGIVHAGSLARLIGILKWQVFAAVSTTIDLNDTV